MIHRLKDGRGADDDYGLEPLDLLLTTAGLEDSQKLKMLYMSTLKQKKRRKSKDLFRKGLVLYLAKVVVPTVLDKG